MTTVESSAFFLRDYSTGNEIIVFGDVEPDSVSLEPHNKRVWETAAPKIAAGTLRGIFIECSYNDSIDDAYLYGHLCPRHLVAELTVLASKVMEVRDSAQDRKRKREDAGAAGESGPDISPRSKRNMSTPGERERKFSAPTMTPGELINLPEMPKSEPVSFGSSHDQLGGLEITNPSRWADADPLPLAGLTVYIIHIKESLTDGPAPAERILRELRAHSEGAHLGCEFVIPNPAEGIWI
jgi:cAMP phosphodiesterases class-II